MSWISNAMMWWSDDSGSTWNKVSDHNRSEVTIDYERIGADQRMVNGTFRRYSVTKKRTFAMSWENLPSNSSTGTGGIGTADGGYGGQQIQDWYTAHDGSFLVKFRKGADDGKAANDGTIETVTCVLTDFSKAVNKRGPGTDLWNISLTLAEV